MGVVDTENGTGNGHRIKTVKSNGHLNVTFLKLLHSTICLSKMGEGEYLGFSLNQPMRGPFVGTFCQKICNFRNVGQRFSAF